MNVQKYLFILHLLLFCLLAESLRATNVCRDRDSLALVEFYNDTDGVNWTIPWDLNMPMDTWHGVGLSADGCVITLETDGTIDGEPTWGGNNLNGTLPQELEDLLDVKELIISYNSNLTGSIPDVFATLLNLEKLLIRENGLSGSLPTSITNCLELTHIEIRDEDITGAIPADIGNLENLIILRLWYLDLGGAIPFGLGNITGLGALGLSNNPNLGGVLPTDLGNLNGLFDLNLSNCNLSGCFPVQYSNLCGNINSSSYNFSGNPALPGGGDFDDFCMNQIGECPPSCVDNILNNGEEDIDCGGPNCDPCPSCDDGILNGDELEVDCGGPACDICAHCLDGVMNSNETGIDCGGPTCVPCGLHPLETWLYYHPKVADKINWNFDINFDEITVYEDWDVITKTALNDLYDDLINGIYPSFPDPPTNVNNSGTGGSVTYLSASDSKDIYLAYVATSLYHEIENVYNWSVLDFSSENIELLYDHGQYFTRWYDSVEDEYVMLINLTSTPSPPLVIYEDFILEEDIIQVDQKSSYAMFLKYARDSLSHFYNEPNYFFWEYDGFPPMSRVIDGICMNNQCNHWTAGCHGTVAFSKWLGFMINIPVSYNYVGVGHRIALLPTVDSLFISHGDDPYSQGTKSAMLEPRHLLVNKLHFEDFFGDGTHNPEKNDGVGKRVSDILFNRISDAYLDVYCDDFLQNGNLNEDNYLGGNYAGFLDAYPLEFFDSIHFWDRIHLSLKADPINYSCFDGFTDPINYEAHSLNWDYLENGIINSDTSIYKQDINLPMYGKSSTCLTTGDWAEMIVYNSQPETWIGISKSGEPTLAQMDYAIRIKNNVVEVMESGISIATISDDFESSVQWLKISIEGNQIKYSLNGFVHHQRMEIDADSNYSIYFGAEDLESEINNIYASTSNEDNCCVLEQLVNEIPIDPSIYNQAVNINSSGVVEENARFLAGTNVSLESGFEVIDSAEFLAAIENCNDWAPVLSPSTVTSTFGPLPDSPFGEEFDKLTDGDITTKFLNFDGFLNVQLNLDQSTIVKTIAVTTANDEPGRDPQELIVSGSYDGNSFFQIGAQVDIECISDRFYTRFYDLDNNDNYSFYRLEFNLKCETTANSMQVSEVQLFGQ